nr:MAG TPA: hypothetical protein [Caudoviricetes sp.]
MHPLPASPRSSFFLRREFSRNNLYFPPVCYVVFRGVYRFYRLSCWFGKFLVTFCHMVYLLSPPKGRSFIL